ncbi:MAG TPA: RNA polymerase sigma factor [Humisphaera sp.]|nr:RNA polymerase sigma factor [Humisphaera sp.]
MEISDLELVRKAAAGDHEAFHALVDRHAKNLFRVALSLSATRADAEDLVQETYAGAFKSLARFDGRASVKTWLMRILMRRAADAWRSGRRARGTARLDDDGGDATEGGRSVGSSTVAVDRRLDVASMLERLAPDHRQILMLREMNGMSYAEIASALEIPQGTVESRLHRAREELRRRLGDYFR